MTERLPTLFDVVSPEKAAEIRAAGARGHTALARAIAGGDVVYVPGLSAFHSARSSAANRSGYLARRGIRVASRREGDGGYIWRVDG